MSTKKGLFDDDSEEDAYVPGGAPQNPPETQATVPAEDTQNLDDEYVPQNYDDNQYQQPEAEYMPVQDNQDEMYKPDANSQQQPFDDQQVEEQYNPVYDEY